MTPTPVDQLREELVAAAARWDALADESTEDTFVAKATQTASKLVDRALSTVTLNALRDVLGPRDPVWYGTSLGRLVALHWLGESVPVGTAAKMLGVTAGRVHQLLGEGKLLRVEDGGVSVRSILDRMEWLDGRETQ